MRGCHGSNHMRDSRVCVQCCVSVLAACSSLKYLSQVFDIRIELDIMMIITMLDGGGQRGIMVSRTNTPFLPFAFALLYHVLQQQQQPQCPEMVMLLL